MELRFNDNVNRANNHHYDEKPYPEHVVSPIYVVIHPIITFLCLFVKGVNKKQFSPIGESI